MKFQKNMKILKQLFNMFIDLRVGERAGERYESNVNLLLPLRTLTRDRTPNLSAYGRPLSQLRHLQSSKSENFKIETDEVILMWEDKETRFIHTIRGRGSKLGDLTLPNFKTYIKPQ